MQQKPDLNFLAISQLQKDSIIVYDKQHRPHHPPDKNRQGQARRPSEPILVDAFFFGYAYLDVNGNSEIDSEDTPLENAMFIVTLQGGMETGDTTDENGNAFITIPGEVDYPVTLRMEAPKDSNLKLIGPSSVTFPSDEPAKFLFTSK